MGNPALLPQMELRCAVQNYHWGVRGPASSVAKLAAAMDSSLAVKADQPFAELWMGTHPNGPSIIKGIEQSRHSLLNLRRLYNICILIN